MGAVSLAARRAAKAIRRKAIIEQKRKVEAKNETLAAQATRGAALPIRQCLVSHNLFENGVGTLIIARGLLAGPVVVSAFLLDSFCRGVKDAMVRTMDQGQLDYYLDMADAATPLTRVDPSYARKLLGDLVDWSETLGFPPHRDFTAAMRLFGNVDPQACDTEFAFGQDGKPLYLSGPSDSPSLARRHVERLREQLGPDGFHYIVAA